MQTKPRDNQSVTSVFSQTVKPGKEKDYEKVQHEIIQAAHGFGGHEDTRVIKDGNHYHIVNRFTDAKRLGAWLSSSQRKEILKRMEPLVEEDEIKPTELTGFEAWFRVPGGHVAPPRWKMLLATMMGAFPVVVLFQAFITPQIEHWHLLLRSVVYMAALLTTMTYVVMPHVTRWLANWLYTEKS